MLQSNPIELREEVKRLGAEASVLWDNVARKPALFPAIAASLLNARAQRLTNYSYTDYAKTTIGDDLPEQSDIEARFGQPPLTLYLEPDFRIEVLFWLEGVPGIHQHAFSGAFCVLEGSSVHAEWSFHPSDSVSDCIILGHLALQGIKILEKGSVHPIKAGGDFIHSTYHLARPSLTMVLRTIRDVGALPQRSYWAPSIAYDPEGRTQLTIRRVQVLQMLLRLRQEEHAIAILHAIAKAHATTDEIVFILMEIFSAFPRIEARETVIMNLIKDQTKAQLVIAAAVEQERRSEIVRIRRAVTDPQLQLLLAICLNVPHLSAAIEVQKSMRPGTASVDILMKTLTDLYVQNKLRVTPDIWISTYMSGHSCEL